MIYFQWRGLTAAPFAYLHPRHHPQKLRHRCPPFGLQRSRPIENDHIQPIVEIKPRISQTDISLIKPNDMTIKNTISWFELPATDLARAQKFYETILDITMLPLETPHIRMRLFPIE